MYEVLRARARLKDRESYYKFTQPGIIHVIVFSIKFLLFTIYVSQHAYRTSVNSICSEHYRRNSVVLEVYTMLVHMCDSVKQGVWWDRFTHWGRVSLLVITVVLLTVCIRSSGSGERFPDYMHLYLVQMILGNSWTCPKLLLILDLLEWLIP